jgi:hypothetical protein
VSITADNGNEPSTTLMNQVYAVLDANREVNFLNFVIKPVYTSVDVKAEIIPYSGVPPADAEESARQSVREWLDAANYNMQPGAEDTWVLDTYVRLYEAVDYINRADGIWRCQNVFLKLSSDDDTHWAAADLLLPGITPMPVAGPRIEMTAI